MSVRTAIAGFMRAYGWPCLAVAGAALLIQGAVALYLEPLAANEADALAYMKAEVAKLKKGSPVVSNAKLDPEIAKLPGVFSTPDQWNKQAIIIDHKLRAEKTAEWRKWFAENIMN